MKHITSIAVLVLLLLPVHSIFAQDASWLNWLSTNILWTFTLILNLLIALALVYFIWGLVIFIAQSDNEQVRTEGRQKMIWGIIALFVIISTWGLVRLLQEITGAGAGATPSAPHTTYTP